MKTIKNLIIDSFNELIEEKIENNKKPFISIFELQMKIYKNSNIHLNGKKLRNNLNNKQLKSIKR